MQILLTHKFEILFYGFGGQCVLPEDQHVMICTPIHLRHDQVCKKVLRKSDYKLKTNTLDKRNGHMTNLVRKKKY